MEETQLRVLTLNVWGLKFISPDRPVRLQGIIDHIRQPVSGSRGVESKSDIAYDVVCLQELWIYSDFEKVRDGLEEVLPESKFFRRCVPCFSSFRIDVSNDRPSTRRRECKIAAGGQRRRSETSRYANIHDHSSILLLSCILPLHRPYIETRRLNLGLPSPLVSIAELSVQVLPSFHVSRSFRPIPCRTLYPVCLCT